MATVPSQGCGYAFGEFHLLWSAKQLDVTYRPLYVLSMLEILLAGLIDEITSRVAAGRFLETAICLNQILDLGVQSLSFEVSFQVVLVNDQPSKYDHRYRQKCLVTRNPNANSPQYRNYDC